MEKVMKNKSILPWILTQLTEKAAIAALVIELWGFCFGPNILVYPAGIIALVLFAAVWCMPDTKEVPVR